jgi:hypothetical protein
MLKEEYLLHVRSLIRFAVSMAVVASSMLAIDHAVASPSTTADSGPGSLRDAIASAHSNYFSPLDLTCPMFALKSGDSQTA